MEKRTLRDSDRLAADPLAVARHADTLPAVALCLLRLLDGRRTLMDVLRYSPVEEETARAVIRRCCELRLAARTQTPESRVQELTPALRDWLADSGHRETRPRPTLPASALEDPAAEIAAALDELGAEPAPPSPVEVDAEVAVAPEPSPARTPSNLHEAVEAHLTPETGPDFDQSDLAFFDSYVPEEPMVDTFSDLVSRPTRRR